MSQLCGSGSSRRSAVTGLYSSIVPMPAGASCAATRPARPTRPHRPMTTATRPPPLVAVAFIASSPYRPGAGPGHLQALLPMRQLPHALYLLDRDGTEPVAPAVPHVRGDGGYLLVRELRADRGHVPEAVDDDVGDVGAVGEALVPHEPRAHAALPLLAVAGGADRGEHLLALGVALTPLGGRRLVRLGRAFPFRLRRLLGRQLGRRQLRERFAVDRDEVPPIVDALSVVLAGSRVAREVVEGAAGVRDLSRAVTPLDGAQQGRV